MATVQAPMDELNSPTPDAGVVHEPFRLGDLVVYPDRNQLVRDQRVIHVEPMSLKLLVLLAETHPKTASKAQIIDRLWNGRIVTDAAISRQIAKLRRALGDRPARPEFIQTVPKVGVRLLTPVQWSVVPDPSGERPRMQSRTSRLRSLLIGLVGLVVVLLVASGLRFALDPATVGGSESPVTSGVGAELDPALSANGVWLAYSAPVENAEGRAIHIRRLTDDEVSVITPARPVARQPAWSPTSDAIAYVQIDESGCSVRIASLPSLASRRIGPCVNPFDGGLAWLDADTLVLSDKAARAGPHGLYLMNIATGQRRALTTPPSGSLGDRRPTPMGARGIYFLRALTGEATQLVTVDPGTGRTRVVVDAEAGLWSIARAGRDTLVLSSNRVSGAEAIWSLRLGDLSWTQLSPPGRYWDLTATEQGGLIVFERPSYRISLWQSEGAGEPFRLTSTTQSDWRPALSPDRSRLAFLSTRAGAVHQVWLAGADGRAPRQLTRIAEGAIEDLAWRPGGASLVISILRDGDYDLLEVDTVTGNVRALEVGDTDDQWPTVSRDGRSLYFSRRTGKGFRLIQRSFETGAEQTVVEGAVRALEGPDGALYFVRPGEAAIWVRGRDGTARRLATFGSQGLSPRDWAIDDQTLSVLTETRELVQLDLRTGQRLSSRRIANIIQPSGLTAHGGRVIYARADQQDVDLYSRQIAPPGFLDRIRALWSRDSQ